MVIIEFIVKHFLQKGLAGHILSTKGWDSDRVQVENKSIVDRYYNKDVNK